MNGATGASFRELAPALARLAGLSSHSSLRQEDMRARHFDAKLGRKCRI